jgi:hypothetical protein
MHDPKRLSGIFANPFKRTAAQYDVNDDTIKQGSGGTSLICLLTTAHGCEEDERNGVVPVNIS